MPRIDEQELLLREWRPFLLSVTRSVCKHTQDVDDAFQEAQLVFLRVYPTFPGGNIRPWIAQVVRRKLYSWFGVQNVYRSQEVLVEDIGQLCGVQSDITDATLDRIEHEEWLATLGHPFNQAVDLCIREGLQQTRAARVAGIPTNTMKSRLDRGKQYLRAIAGEEEIE